MTVCFTGFGQVRHYEPSFLNVGLPGEVGKLLVALPRPLLCHLVAHHPLVTLPHSRHDYFLLETIEHAERIH